MIGQTSNNKPFSPFTRALDNLAANWNRDKDGGPFIPPARGLISSPADQQLEPSNTRSVRNYEWMRDWDRRRRRRRRQTGAVAVERRRGVRVRGVGVWVGVGLNRERQGDCSTIIWISCAERLHARLIASRGIFNKYFIRRRIINA